MSIINRRNAVIGWLTWSVGKRVVAKKAKGAIPSRDGGGGSKGRVALKGAAALAAAAGAVAFWKAKHRDSTDHDSVAAEPLVPGTDEQPAE
jgi:hypothetical protein